MQIIQGESFRIIGIAVRTSNDPGVAEKDIPALWTKFLSENIAGQVAGKMDADIYCVYTHYERDYTKPYTTILGCRVQQDAPAPEGFTSVTIEAGNYALFTAKGNLMEGIVFKAWLGIWNASIARKYTADYEVYGPKAQHPANAEVDIFVAIK